MTLLKLLVFLYITCKTLQYTPFFYLVNFILTFVLTWIMTSSKGEGSVKNVTRPEIHRTGRQGPLCLSACLGRHGPQPATLRSTAGVGGYTQWVRNNIPYNFCIGSDHHFMASWDIASVPRKYQQPSVTNKVIKNTQINPKTSEFSSV